MKFRTGSKRIICNVGADEAQARVAAEKRAECAAKSEMASSVGQHDKAAKYHTGEAERARDLGDDQGQQLHADAARAHTAASRMWQSRASDKKSGKFATPEDTKQQTGYSNQAQEASNAANTNTQIQEKELQKKADLFKSQTSGKKKPK